MEDNHNFELYSHAPVRKCYTNIFRRRLLRTRRFKLWFHHDINSIRLIMINYLTLRFRHVSPFDRIRKKKKKSFKTFKFSESITTVENSRDGVWRTKHVIIAYRTTRRSSVRPQSPGAGAVSRDDGDQTIGHGPALRVCNDRCPLRGRPPRPRNDGEQTTTASYYSSSGRRAVKRFSRPYYWPGVASEKSRPIYRRVRKSRN